MVTFQSVQCQPGLTYIFNFRHYGTCTYGTDIWQPPPVATWLVPRCVKSGGHTRMAVAEYFLIKSTYATV